MQEKFRPVIERNSRELIDAFRHTGSADIVADYATRYPVNVIADMLGLDKAERRYRAPDRFGIFRQDLATTSAFSAAADHLAFALGRHFCVSALPAKAEVETGVNQLLDAMPDLRLADGFDPVEQGVFTRRPQPLPVRFTPVSG